MYIIFCSAKLVAQPVGTARLLCRQELPLKSYMTFVKKAINDRERRDGADFLGDTYSGTDGTLVFRSCSLTPYSLLTT